MILSAFHARNEPEGMLARKIEVSLRYADRLLVILDRWEEGEKIVREAATSAAKRAYAALPSEIAPHHSQFLFQTDWQASVTVLNDRPADPVRVSGLDEWGRPMCEEGRLRQLAWDWCVGTARGEPAWFVFGDTDEILTTDALGFFRNPPPDDDGIDVYTLDILNLYGPPDANGTHYYLGGTRNPYSPHARGSHKRSAIVRYRPGKLYAPIPDGTHHIDPAPPGLKSKWIKHPKVLHYKFEDLARWEANPQSKSAKYGRGPGGYMEHVDLEPVPASYLWDEGARA